MRNNRKFKRHVFYMFSKVCFFTFLWWLDYGLFPINKSHSSRKRRDDVIYDQMCTFGNYLEQGKCDHHIVHWNIWRARKKRYNNINAPLRLEHP